MFEIIEISASKKKAKEMKLKVAKKICLSEKY
jgi:hypothetical protein